jgi:hypothetical protein
VADTNERCVDSCMTRVPYIDNIMFVCFIVFNATFSNISAISWTFWLNKKYYSLHIILPVIVRVILSFGDAILI